MPDPLPPIPDMLADLRRMHLRCPGCVSRHVLNLVGKDKLTLDQQAKITAAWRALGLKKPEARP